MRGLWVHLGWCPSGHGCHYPLNLILYMPFRIFAYSSNILKTTFDLMTHDSIPVCWTLKWASLPCGSCSFGDLVVAMKLL
jgi:hypothetical protein